MGYGQPQAEENHRPLLEIASPTDSSDAFIYKAVPAVVEADSPQQTNNESSIEATSPIQPNLLEISSDSDLSVERIYNLHSGKVYEKVGDMHKEIDRTKSPEIVNYSPTKEFDKGNLAFDENHNATTNDRKRDFLRSLTQTTDDIYSPVTSPTTDDVFSDKSTSTPTYQESNHTTDVPFTTTKASEIGADTNITNSQLSEVSKTDLHTTADSLLCLENDTSINSKEFSLEYSTDDNEESKSSQENFLIINEDPEIEDLKDKHLVKNRLGLFSKSYPNLAAVPLRKASSQNDVNPNEDNVQKTEKITSNSVRILDKSVDDLRKQFDNHPKIQLNSEELSKNPVYSLTARSIPREFRQELKGKENGTEFELQSSSISTTKPSMEPEEPKTFPTAKSRIQFFENLNK